MLRFKTRVCKKYIPWSFFIEKKKRFSKKLTNRVKNAAKPLLEIA
jgi:hypothetical protein